MELAAAVDEAARDTHLDEGPSDSDDVLPGAFVSAAVNRNVGVGGKCTYAHF